MASKYEDNADDSHQNHTRAHQGSSNGVHQVLPPPPPPPPLVPPKEISSSNERRASSPLSMLYEMVAADSSSSRSHHHSNLHHSQEDEEGEGEEGEEEEDKEHDEIPQRTHSLPFSSSITSTSQSQRLPSSSLSSLSASLSSSSSSSSSPSLSRSSLRRSTREGRKRKPVEDEDYIDDEDDDYIDSARIRSAPHRRTKAASSSYPSSQSTRRAAAASSSSSRSRTNTSNDEWSDHTSQNQQSDTHIPVHTESPSQSARAIASEKRTRKEHIKAVEVELDGGSEHGNPHAKYTDCQQFILLYHPHSSADEVFPSSSNASSSSSGSVINGEDEPSSPLTDPSSPLLKEGSENRSQQPYTIRVVRVLNRHTHLYEWLIHAGDLGGLVERRSNISRLFGCYLSPSEKLLARVCGSRNRDRGQRGLLLTEQGTIRFWNTLSTQFWPKYANYKTAQQRSLPHFYQHLCEWVTATLLPIFKKNSVEDTDLPEGVIQVKEGVKITQNSSENIANLMNAKEKSLNPSVKRERLQVGSPLQHAVNSASPRLTASTINPPVASPASALSTLTSTTLTISSSALPSPHSSPASNTINASSPSAASGRLCFVSSSSSSLLSSASSSSSSSSGALASLMLAAFANQSSRNQQAGLSSSPSISSSSNPPSSPSSIASCHSIDSTSSSSGSITYSPSSSSYGMSSGTSTPSPNLIGIEPIEHTSTEKKTGDLDDHSVVDEEEGEHDAVVEGEQDVDEDDSGDNAPEGESETISVSGSQDQVSELPSFNPLSSSHFPIFTSHFSPSPSPYPRGSSIGALVPSSSSSSSLHSFSSSHIPIHLHPPSLVTSHQLSVPSLPPNSNSCSSSPSPSFSSLSHHKKALLSISTSSSPSAIFSLGRARGLSHSPIFSPSLSPSIQKETGLSSPRSPLSTSLLLSPSSMMQMTRSPSAGSSSSSSSSTAGIGLGLVGGSSMSSSASSASASTYNRMLMTTSMHLEARARSLNATKL